VNNRLLAIFTALSVISIFGLNHTAITSGGDVLKLANIIPISLVFTGIYLVSLKKITN